jgi:hypothetical protein
VVKVLSGKALNKRLPSGTPSDYQVLFSVGNERMDGFGLTHSERRDSHS